MTDFNVAPLVKAIEESGVNKENVGEVRSAVEKIAQTLSPEKREVFLRLSGRSRFDLQDTLEIAGGVLVGVGATILTKALFLTSTSEPVIPPPTGT